MSTKGPAKKLGLEPGHIILELNGEDITRLDIRQIVFLLAEKKGQIFEIGVGKDSRFNFEQAMMDTQRTVWFQRNDDSSSGLQLMSTDDGPRVERLLDNSAASIAAINVGDRIVEINNLEMQNSSGVEIFAALGLGTDHILVLNPDSSPVIRSSGSSIGAFHVGESETSNGGNAGNKSGNSLKGATKGKRKQITLTALEKKMFGFGVGSSLDDVGTRVQNLAPGGAADKSGKVRIGDRILMANGLDLSQASTAEVVACLSMNRSVTLILEEDPTPLGSESISPSKAGKRNRLARRGAKRSKRETTDANSTDGIGPVREIRIKRAPGSGLGLKILTDEECRIARISEIIPGRPADLCGGINIGDRLISANGTSLRNLTHENIVRVMLADTDVTVLELASDSAPMIDDSVRKTVTIHREPGEGIGLKIHSTQQSDGTAVGARISEIIPGRPASKTGNISPGDWLIEANGVVLEGIPHDQIVGVLTSIKATIVTLVLEPDDTPIEDVEAENNAALMEHTTIFGEKSLLNEIRTVTVQRSADGMLGFQFYSEVGLPWTRVCDIVPGSPCSMTELEQEDVIVTIDGTDVLNLGHDPVLHALQNAGQVTVLQVACPPANESAADYRQPAGGSPGNAALHPTNRHLPMYEPYLAYVPRDEGPLGFGIISDDANRGARIDAVVEGSPAAEVGIQNGDILLKVDGTVVVDTGHEGVVNELSRWQDKPIEMLLGRKHIPLMVELTRKSKKKVWGFELHPVGATGGVAGSEPTRAGTVSTVKDGSAAAIADVRPGDVVLEIHGVNVEDATENSAIDAEMQKPSESMALVLLRAPDVSFSYTTIRVHKEPTDKLGFGLCTLDEKEGAFVTKLRGDSVSRRAGLRENDWIYAINECVIGTKKHTEVLKLVTTAPDASTISFTIRPNADVDPSYSLSDSVPRLVSMQRSPSQGLGMKIITASDGVSYPRISQVLEDGAAKQTRLINVGDRILRVNSEDLKGASHDKAIQTLVQMETLELVLQKDVSPMPSNTIAGEGTDTSDDTPVSSPVTKKKMALADIGRRVSVDGYPGLGTIKFVGHHKITRKLRCGVEMDSECGRNNGTVKGHPYFKCAADRGVLVTPHKVSFVGPRVGKSGSPLKLKPKSPKVDVEEAMKRVMALAGELNQLADEHEEREDNEDLPVLPSFGGGDDEDEDDLPNLVVPPDDHDDDDDDDDDDELPTLAGGGGDDTDDEDLPDFAPSDDDDEALPAFGNAAGDDDDELPPPPEYEEVDLDALTRMLGYDASADTEI